MSVLPGEGGDLTSSFPSPAQSPGPANQSFGSVGSLDVSLSSSHTSSSANANLSYASATSEDLFGCSPDTPSSIDSGLASPEVPNSYVPVSSPGDGVKNESAEPAKLDEKPSHSYIALISMAILASSKKKLVLKDIYQYIMDNFPYYRSDQQAWKNSIRHNLSLNECFYKAGRVEKGKGNYWAIHPACIDDFSKGDYRRRHARRRARGKDPYNISALPLSQRHHMGYVPMSAMPLIPGYHQFIPPQRTCVPNLAGISAQCSERDASVASYSSPGVYSALTTAPYQHQQSQNHTVHHAPFSAQHSMAMSQSPIESPYGNSANDLEQQNSHSSQFFAQSTPSSGDRMNYPGIVYCDQPGEEMQSFW